MILSDHSMCMIPHQGIMSLLSSPFLIRPFVELRVGNEKKHTYLAYIAKSKTRSNRENRSYNQIKMCMCAEFFWMDSHPFPHDFIFYFEVWAIFLFLFLFPMLLGTGIYIFFCIAHAILHDEESCQSDGVSFCMWMEDMFLRNFQCRSQHEYMWSLCDLDLKSMK